MWYKLKFLCISAPWAKSSCSELSSVVSFFSGHIACLDLYIFNRDVFRKSEGTDSRSHLTPFWQCFPLNIAGVSPCAPIALGFFWVRSHDPCPVLSGQVNSYYVLDSTNESLVSLVIYFFSSSYLYNAAFSFFLLSCGFVWVVGTMMAHLVFYTTEVHIHSKETFIWFWCILAMKFSWYLCSSLVHVLSHCL